MSNLPEKEMKALIASACAAVFVVWNLYEAGVAWHLISALFGFVAFVNANTSARHTRREIERLNRAEVPPRTP